MFRPRDSSGRFTTFRAFARRMRERAAAVVHNSNDNVVRLATMIEQAIVTSTPVDTGHARANWQVGLDVEPTEVLNEVDPSGASTISKAVTVLSDRKSEQTIHITNNVPYIKRLNDGWSAQAPANFVELSINSAIQAFRNAKVIR